jgi:membrane protein insertase Oxa1/YidC/SpoIIIJ
VATREPARVNRLLSVLAEWFQIDIAIALPFVLRSERLPEIPPPITLR